MLPRERLEQYGVESLSESDLLAIIIGSGSKDMTVFDIAKSLTEGENLHNLLGLSLQELTRIKGIKKAKATKILASIELAKRIFKYSPKKFRFKDADSIFNYLKSYYLGKKEEEVVVMYFDKSLSLIKMMPVYKGKDESVEFEFGPIVKFAYKYESNYLIIAHNHPSGILKPSSPDIMITKKFIRQTKDLDIVLLDHLIITSDGYYSFAANNILH